MVTAASALSVHDLVVATGPRGRERVVLRGGHLEVAAGEVLLVLGDAGSGKTLTASVLAGHYPARFGRIDGTAATQRRGLLRRGGRPAVPGMRRRPVWSSVDAAAAARPALLVIDDADELPAPDIAALLRRRRADGLPTVLFAAHAVAGADRVIRLDRGALLPGPAARAAARTVVLPPDELRTRTAAALHAAGTPREVADRVADVLVDADVRGHRSHGVGLLPMYLDRIRAGGIDPRATPELTVRDGTAAVHAGGGFGQPAADLAARWCARTAASHGVAAVSVHHNNHIGMLAAYRRPFQEHGAVGLLLNISGPSVAAPGARRPTLGSNAICLVTARADGEPFVIDLATGVVAAGKIRNAEHHGRPVPPGWLLDRQGRPSTDARELDLGGSIPVFGDYKGLCITLMAEILAGVLGGQTVSPLVSKQRKYPDRSMDCSQLFVGFGLAAFGSPPVDDLVDRLHDAVLAGHDTPPPRPYFPDQLEADATSTAQRDGIEVPAAVAAALEVAA
ncbi:Ldh family oxidoreductase [Micromonospora sp. PLK6-60]|uniref:Ldh family oxidoreductase n=1 Tax=Micromonospora sp. PLK6-60 TaxID=2873383 RepID=UPI001CA6CFB9|nr:Ldh family oxidoreductase [Micromonospora sp. PLK6-60]MBY8870655.1 Ldh family oxidoreductase [Micromonospora sp. PLK6-60]